MHAMTAAHKTITAAQLRRGAQPGRTAARWWCASTTAGRSKDGRVIDLSHAAARKLGISGIAKVEVRRLTHAEIRSGSWKLPAQRVAEAASP